MKIIVQNEKQTFFFNHDAHFLVSSPYIKGPFLQTGTSISWTWGMFVHFCSLFPLQNPLRANEYQLKKVSLTLSGPVFFWGQSGTEGGGGQFAPPHPVSQHWGIWEIGAKHDYCCLFSKNFFEIYNFSVAQNLRILETTMRFCWKCQKIRTIF